MLLKKYLFFILFVWSTSVSSQIKGIVIDNATQKPIENVTITLKNSITKTDTSGVFSFSNIPFGEYQLEISHPNYETQRFTIKVTTNELDLGTIALTETMPDYSQNDATILLTEDELDTDESFIENTTGFLQATRDIFQQRAAFDFGQAFFRIKGYDAQNGTILINGLEQNSLFNGRPQWSLWGGLNDAIRNQELSYGLNNSNTTFGGVLGATNIKMKASSYRKGTRITSSLANRSYQYRLMGTYNSGLINDKFAYSFTASKRYGNEGYIDVTFYDSYSVFGAFEYKINSKNSVNLTAIYAPVKRGQNAPITQRVFNEMGRRYNPNWGFQEGEKRNSRVIETENPMFMFTYFHESKKLNITTNILYQTGIQKRSRLDYANAPNPNPNYWRYLPEISENSQLNWQSMYNANQNTQNTLNFGSKYMLYNDVVENSQLQANTIVNVKLTNKLSFDSSLNYHQATFNNYAQPKDLLGADFYYDANFFNILNGNPALNDAENNPEKGIDDKIKYNFDVFANKLDAFAQLNYSQHNFDVFMSGKFQKTDYQREGNFLNKSFETNSLGKSEKVSFNDVSVKAGGNFRPNGRHLFAINAAYISKPPTIQNTFVNSRENNLVVPDLQSEKILSGEFSYLIRLPKIKAKLTAYYTNFKDKTDINFFFAETGSGADFFQEVVTNINTIHQGIEFGGEYQFTDNFSFNAVASVGQHFYNNNPNVRVNFDVNQFNNDVISNTGFKDFGESHIKNYSVANGPQQAYSIGFKYNDPKYWWVGASTNYLAQSYIQVSTITRTNSFFNNPDDFGLPYENIDENLAKKLLQQEQFDNFYLLNLVGGKSWKIKDNYLGIFASINNVFDAVYKTGGFEQSRTATYGALLEDVANGEENRNFGNRYWFGYGRTYFLNISYSF